MLHYILQTVAFQLFFLIIYDLFLKKETFFNWNRFYLLTTAIASIILPFIKFESIRTMVPEQFVIRLPEVIIGEVKPIVANGQIDIQSEAITNSNFIWSWDLMLYAGMVLAGLVFIYKIIKISALIQKNPKQWNGNLVIVNLLKSNAAFSFFNYIFLGEWIKEGERETVLKHELVHVSQKHSVDLLLFELLRILFWFNPLIYMYQNRLMALHEYIADSKAMRQGDKKQYYEKLLSQVFDTEHISFTNTFFNQSLIKKRIVMLSRSKSRRIHLLKYALLIPMVFGMLMYTSCQKEAEIENSELSLEQFSYTLKMPGKMTDEQKKIHNDYESFLRNNSDYVAWAEIDYEKDEVRYSVHNKNEKVPEGFIELQVGGAIGERAYPMFINLKETSQTIDVSSNKFVANDYEGAIEVPFSVIEKAPTFSECESLPTMDEIRDCTRNTLSDFVNKNFNTKIAKEAGLIGRQRISVVFKIGKDGKIYDVKSRAPHPLLEAEAIRVISALPQMIPGKQKGKNVVVPYSLPILFEVSE